jgi:hypothetical protein
MNIAVYLAWWNKPYDVTQPIRVSISVPITEEATERLYYWADPNSNAEQTVERAGNYMIGSQDKFTDIRAMKKVPIFYSGSPSNESVFIADAAALLVGIIFGSIHLIGWSFHSSTHAELVLWRLSSAIIVGIPACFFVFSGIPTGFKAHIRQVKRSISQCTGVEARNPLNILVFWTSVMVVMLYVAARLTALVLAFSTLHSLPPGAYQAIPWINPIPHI